jgi:serine/threonine protein kinase
VTRAVEEYLALLEAGRRPGREEFLARYPELAPALAECLDGLDFVRSAAPHLSRPAATPADEIGPATPLGDFRILREVGRGGMGVVYEAEQLSLGRRVALKVLPFAATMDPRQLQRFHNEARAAASLDHPHVVHVHAVGCERGVHYYAMQFIDGQTVEALIRQLRQGTAAGPGVPTDSTSDEPKDEGTPRPDTVPEVRAGADTRPSAPDRGHYRRAAELGIQAAEALEHAHALGVVHRDVKPGNLLLDAHGKVWVTDFGLAQVQSDVRLTMTGDLVGTLRYMSPEQALAKRVVIDHRTDVYSLGATLYELLTLQPAFSGGDRQELLRQIAFEEPRPPRRLNRAVPAELETIVLKALEKHPAERYATAQELADDLRRYLSHEPIQARRPTLAQRARKWARRHPAAVRAGAAVLLVVAASLGWGVRDRAARRAASDQAVAQALAESAEYQKRRRYPEALAAARRAEELAAASAASGELQGQARRRRADLDLVLRLDDVRFEWSPNETEEGIDYAWKDRRYGEEFRAAGIEVDGMAAGEAAERIRATTVATELAVALDCWAMDRRQARGKEDAGWKQLLEAARLADPDPLRCRIREALAAGDAKGPQRGDPVRGGPGAADPVRSAPGQRSSPGRGDKAGHRAAARRPVAGPGRLPDEHGVGHVPSLLPPGAVGRGCPLLHRRGGPPSPELPRLGQPRRRPDRPGKGGRGGRRVQSGPAPEAGSRHGAQQPRHRVGGQGPAGQGDCRVRRGPAPQAGPCRGPLQPRQRVESQGPAGQGHRRV